jgi:hypothetical protein
MNPAKGNVDSSGKFKVQNRWDKGMNIAVTCDLHVDSDGPDSGPVPGAFYITAQQVLKDEEVELTPIDKVRVWFQANVSTGSMIGQIFGPSLEVDFSGGKKEQTVSYNSGGTWQLGPLPSA